MKKRSIFVVFSLLLILIVSGCSNKSALKFKEDYERLNGKENASGKIHRTITIDKNNPFESISASDVLKKINNSETFYVYFGDELCPWCRSVLEKAIEVAKKNNINKIYYVKIWDNEGNEVLRSKYKLKDNNEIEEVTKGTSEYYELLKHFDELLSDYTLNSSDSIEIKVGEKRIFAPNFIYVKDGKAIKLEEGISALQTDSRSELTNEMLEEEEKLFEEFFNN